MDHKLLVIDDVGLLVNSIESKGYKLSEKAKKWRGQVNAINNKLSCIDIYFITSSYNHSVHHSCDSYLIKTIYSHEFRQCKMISNWVFELFWH